MSHDNSDPTTQELTRRTVLRGAAGTAAAGVALGSVGTTAAQSGGSAPYGGWFEGVENFDGTVDKTGQSEVTVTVGAQGNGGSFAFGPAAVRVDPGTKVVWKWSGGGGSHNVVAEDGSFESELVGESGHTFSHTFESEGISKYACVPHKAMGMKGAVVVGDVSVGGGEAAGESSGSSGPGFDGWFDNVDNFDGVVDETGQSEVTVTVGAEGNNGAFAFDPPAIRVDPGTTVVWEWTGGGGSHNVVAEDGSFESELVGESGHTFSHTFESEGTTKYACVPHKPMGMKGAVVVGGDSAAGGAGGGSDGGDGGNDFRDGLTLGAGLGLVGVLVTTFVFGSKSETRGGRSTN
ncbi:halocyanin domain-containing protein [Halogranum gelatinilyticum]|uniref:Halocyanin domain-containing protein n=1 Tax=Halogranum gelatinilyticum TaxID=660521 RepID=A0A1G9XD13_9EURY|nr:halocyanin domain-containing protein [Halogranum gelatinilyticum]SDM94650.1 halocyanin domain-containing protein [Halogranum gelatinilyticum]